MRNPSDLSLSSHIQNLSHNLAMVNALAQIAQSKGITPAQLSISWVSSLGQHVIPLPGSSYVLAKVFAFRTPKLNPISFCRQVKRTIENLGAGDVTLSMEEVKEINDIIAAHEVKGDRYFGNDRAALLWG